MPAADAIVPAEELGTTMVQELPTEVLRDLSRLEATKSIYIYIQYTCEKVMWVRFKLFLGPAAWAKP